MACSFGRYRAFEQSLTGLVGEDHRPEPTVTLYGSGDFHHVSLALLRRLRAPFNLLVLDKHPDWMRAIPFLHCGTWLYHALRLPLLQRVFHVGGDLDFDNHYRWLAPWRELRQGKIIVMPAIRSFHSGGWADMDNPPVRSATEAAATPAHLAMLLRPFRHELASCPLYISVDKDVLHASEAAVNWDSGHLRSTEVQTILTAFLSAAQGRLAGADLLGDWSPVVVQGLLRQFLHRTEHPVLSMTSEKAAGDNGRLNVALLQTIKDLVHRGWEKQAIPAA
jgi:arginase family enzyme